ncbi:hypothetical protein IV38_GL001181 [Lactobacillus selangorensis]|uniref:HTH cro/C1-type domain-containing protein n=1 Tax=Lactobacillus selangorensis TaxID=81857 RepID=A0A0R2FX96_9LACO|nr:LBP_cg2779 family protein [Lactobacillus selangorensis]KRN28968.1 hypothetical protein IV38_GL001181 [Lactobacillus selangorensis]KRN32622.1 hypothetical protein IV40_GL000672 [Lactobacillus selangorensis]
MNDNEQLSDFAEAIIHFQKKHDLTDSELAFDSHVSVEHIHDIKSMRRQPTADDIQSLTEYMQEHK